MHRIEVCHLLPLSGHWVLVGTMDQDLIEDVIAHRAQVLTAEMIKGSLDLLVEWKSPGLKIDAFAGAQHVVSYDVNGVMNARVMLALGVIVTTANVCDLNAIYGAFFNVGHVIDGN